MFKKCRFCSFKNPIDVDECLACHKDLPATIADVHEAFKTVSDLAQGKVGNVGTRVATDIVQHNVSTLKYRFHPIWVLRVKLHHLKQALISIFWFFAIIGIIVIMGLIYNFLSKILGK